MAKITKTMVDNLNNVLKELGVGIMYKLTDTNSVSPAIQIGVLDPVGFIDTNYGCIINCTDKYYEWLNTWFLDKYGIRLIYNNTRSICWSDDFSKEDA